jgi:hypothetical protein
MPFGHSRPAAPVATPPRAAELYVSHHNYHMRCVPICVIASVLVFTLALAPTVRAGSEGTATRQISAMARPSTLQASAASASDPRSSIPNLPNRFTAPDSKRREEAEDRRAEVNLLIAERAADAAESQASTATLGLAVTTLGTGLLLWSIALTRKATSAATAAAEAATRQVQAIVQTERANLVVTDIALRLVRSDPNEGRLLLPEVTYVNHGRSAAMVIKAGLQIRLTSSSQLDAEPTYQETVDCDPASIGSLYIKPGESFTDRTLGTLRVPPDQEPRLGSEGLFIWVWGHIEYMDPFETITDAGFVAFQYPEVKVGDQIISRADFRFKGPAAYTFVRRRVGKLERLTPNG